MSERSEENLFHCSEAGCTNDDYLTLVNCDGPVYPITDVADGRALCWQCSEQRFSYATPIVVYPAKGHKYKFRSDTDFLWEEDEDGDWSPERARAFRWAMQLARHLAYVKIDGWRGYLTFETAPRGFRRVICSSCGVDGYTFGDDDAIKLQRRFDREEYFYPMIVAFPKTSNVCVVGVEVFVPTRKVHAFSKYLQEAAE